MLTALSSCAGWVSPVSFCKGSASLTGDTRAAEPKNRTTKEKVFEVYYLEIIEPFVHGIQGHLQQTVMAVLYEVGALWS